MLGSEDLEATAARLTAAGVDHGGPQPGGGARLVVLAGAEGVHAFTRERLAFRPGPCPGTETLAAGVLRQLSALGQARQALPKLTQAQLDALLSF